MQMISMGMMFGVFPWCLFSLLLSIYLIHAIYVDHDIQAPRVLTCKAYFRIISMCGFKQINFNILFPRMYPMYIFHKPRIQSNYIYQKYSIYPEWNNTKSQIHNNRKLSGELANFIDKSHLQS